MTLLKDIPKIIEKRSSNQFVCKTCFMNGKSCIYQREIIRKQKTIDKGKIFNDTFMLMPFKTILDEVYRTQFEPCFNTFSSKVKRADDIMMTGFVICEKICKQIQESQFVSAELTFNNSNVFYELGLAYALNKNIALFVQHNLFDSRKTTLKKLNADSDDKVNSYEPFGLLEANTIKFWNTYEKEINTSKNSGITILLADKTEFSETINEQTVTYRMDSICKGSIHKAIKAFDDTDSLWNNVSTKTITIDESGYSDGGKTFKDVEDSVRESKCVIICTSPIEPSSYFWLGFAHGLEKDVIPITVYDEKKANDPNKQMLPFDVRALWHIYMSPSQPIALEKQVYNILEIISGKGKETKNRRNFWKEILDSGSASIFVGSVELTEKNNRHVVGEWDYRTVSELISFFNSIQETMETFIQTPVFQTSSLFHSKTDEEKRQFIENEKTRLKNLLLERNSIIVGSADVNDMTEVALAAQSKSPAFSPEVIEDPDFNGIVGFKDVSEVTLQYNKYIFQMFI